MIEKGRVDAMRNIVIIAGNFVMPDGDAAAVRVRGIAQVLSYNGYKIILQGKNFEKNSSKCNSYKLDEFIWKTRPPYKRKTYYFDCQYLIDTIQEAGIQRVKALILYHHPAIPVLKIQKYCKKNNIMLVTDTTEWYSLYQLRANKHAVFTIADFYLRMLYVNRKVGNLIVISSYLRDYYQSNKARVIQIPILNINKEYKLPERTWDCLRICYCGSPAKKDLLEPIVNTVQKTNENGNRVELHIVGVSEIDYCNSHPGVHNFGDYIRFYGRVEHSKAIEILRQCDFSTIIRRDERYAKAGFPTKMVEALSNGVGVIATPCGDIPHYVKNDNNGYLISFKSVELELERLLLYISSLSNVEICRIKKNALITAERCFSPQSYSDRIAGFFSN